MNHSVYTVLNWSSGKDAALAYHRLHAGGRYEVKHLLTTVNADHNRIVMHGVREHLLDAQAERMGLPLMKVRLPAAPDDSQYKAAMHRAVTELKAKGFTAFAFGDIFLDDLKEYRERQLEAKGIEAVFPLWKEQSQHLVREMEASGIEAKIVCVNAACLGKEFLGRKVDSSLLADLPEGVDACGENGEFHTFVYNAPYFSSPVPIQAGETVCREYGEGLLKSEFYFLDLF